MCYMIQGSIKNKLTHVKSLGTVPIKHTIPSRHDSRNKEIVGRVVKQLEFDKYNVQYSRESLKRCLYPSKDILVPIDADRKVEVRNKVLIGQGRHLLNLQWNIAMLRLFKRTPDNLNGFDFNYSEKSSILAELRQRDITRLYVQYLRDHDLKGIARIEIPADRVSSRLQKRQDLQAFLGIMGYISLLNSEPTLINFINRSIIIKIINPLIS